jgi:hypothetical protein
MSARNNFWQNVNRLKSPSIYAVLNDQERLELTESIKRVHSSNTLIDPTDCYLWANDMIKEVNNRLTDLQQNHFKMYRQ